MKSYTDWPNKKPSHYVEQDCCLVCKYFDFGTAYDSKKDKHYFFIEGCHFHKCKVNITGICKDFTENKK